MRDLSLGKLGGIAIAIAIAAGTIISVRKEMEVGIQSGLGGIAVAAEIMFSVKEVNEKYF